MPLTPLRVAAFGVRALLEQQLDDRRVARLGRAQQRRRAGAEHAVAAAIELGAIGQLRAQRARRRCAPLASSFLMTSRLRQRRRRSRVGAGRFDAGIVCASTAAYSAVWPTLSAMFTSAPRSISSAGDVEVAVDQREDRARVWRSGSTTLMSAPASSSTLAQSTQPSRAAKSSGVSPPGGSHLSRGSGGALPLPGDDRRARVDVGAGLDRARASSSAWPSRRRPHQRRLAAPVLDRRRPTRRAASSTLRGVDVARARAGVQRRFAERAGGVRR